MVGELATLSFGKAGLPHDAGSHKIVVHPDSSAIPPAFPPPWIELTHAVKRRAMEACPSGCRAGMFTHMTTFSQIININYYEY
jgi:hypothetical protein